MQARRIATKLAATAAMSDDPLLGTRRTATYAEKGSIRRMLQFEMPGTTTAFAENSDAAIQRVLDQGMAQARALVQRNRAPLEALVGALLDKKTLDGAEVRGIIEEGANPEDLARKREAAKLQLL